MIAAVGLLLAASLGFPDMLRDEGMLRDAEKDWLVVKAITGPGSPSENFEEIALIHLGTDQGGARTHPRTPGALLLMLPLAFLPAAAASPAVVVLNILSVVVLAWIAVRLTGIHWLWFPILGVGMMWTPFVQASFGAAAIGPLVAALVAAAWWRKDHDDSGLWLGLATVLKLYPGLLIPMLWAAGKRRLAYTACGVFAVVNLAGLLLPDVSLVGQLDTLINRAPDPWSMDLGLPFWFVAVAVAGLVWVSRLLPVGVVFAFGSVAMIVLSPLVWSHYLPVLFVPAVYVVAGLPGADENSERRVVDDRAWV